ncbi:MAG: hypothetical protein OQL28_10260 [Sedimenticola sp.]|nr:hypothetical protein [Sedimenticola sp.]
MQTLHPLLLSLLLAPLPLQADRASDIEAATAEQRKLQEETRQLQEHNAGQQRRLKRLEQAIAQQRERNRRLDSELKKEAGKAANRYHQGK